MSPTRVTSSALARALPIVLCVAAASPACTEDTPPPDSDDTSAPTCQTPAVEALYPPFDFSGTDQAVLPPRPACDGAGSTGAGPGPNGNPSSGAGGAGPGPGPDDSNADAGLDDNARVPPPALNPVANEYGTSADVVMPDISRIQSTLAEDFSTTLQTNGRQCQTCHGADFSWSTTPAAFQARFDQGLPYFSGLCSRYPSNDTATTNDELEPIFRKRDGANSPLSDLSSPDARRSAYSLLLSRAVIRIGLPVPSDAEFELVTVDDPYGFASAAELSLFRRSPPMANLRFHSTLMWDGRETQPCATLTTSLEQQAKNAITGHAEGLEPSAETLATITHAELGIYLAQQLDDAAGILNEDGAHGGPMFLAQVPFHMGINAFDNRDPEGKAYNPEVFSLYGAWRDLPADSERNRARAQIAEGERLFNAREFEVEGVSGFNDVLVQQRITATCGACHNTPNVGTNSEGRLMNIGVSEEVQRAPELPLYTFRNKATGATKTTTDPGQALVSKKWAHMARFKVPILRGLAGRAPYLHNGSAATLEATIDYHDRRFHMQLTATERAALVAFLAAL